jgi:metal-responsive CopG/Arc/MetJ family transcriptional regulator
MLYISMKRTQIYLDQKLASNLRIGARIKNISTSEYIRTLLKSALNKERSHRNALKKKPVSTLVDISMPFGITDLARNADTYIEKSLL